jgi:hypothetical protein
MQREKVPARAGTLARWLEEERDAPTVAALLSALRGVSGSEARSHLEAVFRNRKQTMANRLLAVSLFLEGPGGQDQLAAVAEAVEDGPVLAALLRAVGARKARGAAKLLVGKLASADVEVRSALGAVAGLTPDAREAFQPPTWRPRARPARWQWGRWPPPGADQLLKLARDPTRRSADLARSCAAGSPCRWLSRPGRPETAVKAIECVGELGGPAQAGAVAEHSRAQPSAEVWLRLARCWPAGRQEGLLSPGGRRSSRLAEIHGGSGVCSAGTSSGR